MKAAIEAELRQIAVNPQEHFLVDVARILFRVQKIERHAKHVVVIRPHKLFEGFRIPALRGPNQIDFARTLAGACHAYVPNNLCLGLHHNHRRINVAFVTARAQPAVPLAG
jgi:hypothetical protein